MNIVVVSNENYIQHTAVMLLSLFESNKDSFFRIFLFTDFVSNESKSRLKQLCDNYNNKIFFHLPEQELLQECRINIDKLNSGKWSKMIYYKLFMPILLPVDVERCLFLDVDMVVVDNIKPLYNTNLDGNTIIAAVEDLLSCIPRKKALGLDMSDKYINSGVMVCNISRWREEESKRPIFNFVLDNSNKIINEQDVIALYMKNRIKILPLRWNMVGCNYLRQKFVFPQYYSELRAARKKPAIHHFCTMTQPWYADCKHPYRKLYIKYLKKYSKLIGININMKFPYKDKPKNLYQKIRYSVGRILNLFDIIKQPGYILHKIRY